MGKTVKPNETPREELLYRDISLLLNERNILVEENNWLKERIKELETMRIIICPNCSEDMAEVKEDHYECKECGMKARQLTIFEENVQKEKDELGFFLYMQRKEMKLSITELSRKIDVSTTTLANYEKGKGNIHNMREVVNRLRKIRRGGV